MPLSDPDAALERIRAIALALPRTGERPSHGQPTFFVAEKMFAQFRHDHHGDGRTVVVVRTGSDDEAAELMRANPSLYSRPAYFRRDWVSLAVGREDTDWEHVGGRLLSSWELVAPARLLAVR